MPRDGSGQYTYPPGTPGIPDTTIESAKYNGYIADIQQDLNLPRPIVAGGTGANSADGALVNVSGEKAAQLVTSYDTQVWFPGSFRSAAAAAGAPNGTSSFVGTAYINEALVNPPTNQNVVLEARDQNDTGYVPGRTYVREKKAGVWSAWTGGIYAAPFDALAYNGMQVNGGMEVSQEFGTSGVAVPMIASGSNNDKIIFDGWHLIVAGGGAGANLLGSSQGATDAGGYIFPARMQIHANTRGFIVGSTTDYCLVRELIEGFRVSRLQFGYSQALPVTISFHVNVARAGTMGLSLRNAGATRNITKTVSLNAGWNYKSVTFPGDTSGTWLTNNGIGLYVDFCLAAGSAELVPVDVWSSAIGFGPASGQANFLSGLNDVVLLTGVTVLPGTQAPTAAQSPLIMRPYDQELVTCQRYWRGDINFSIEFQATAASQNGSCTVTFNMRSAPTFTTSQIVPAVNVSAPAAVYSPVPSSIALLCTSGAAGRAYYYGNIRLDARL